MTKLNIVCITALQWRHMGAMASEIKGILAVGSTDEYLE